MKLSEVAKLLPHVHDEVLVSDDGDTVSFQIYSGASLWPNIPPCCGDGVKGHITIERLRGDWYVTDVESRIRGYGVVLYDLAIEYSSENGRGLLPHRAYGHQLATTSDSAERIWKFYFNSRADVAHELISDTQPPWLHARYHKSGDLLSGLVSAGLIRNVK